MYTLAADFTLVVVGVSVVVVFTCTHGVILWPACAQEERATLKGNQKNPSAFRQT